MINKFLILLIFILLQMLPSQAFSASQPSCVHCQFVGDYGLICQPNFVLSCDAVKEIPKKVDFKEKRPSKSHAKTASSDTPPKPLRGGSSSGTLEQDINPRPVSTTKYEWDILDPRPYTALLPEWYNSLSSRPSKESPPINSAVTSEYLERVNKQNLEFLHESVQELQNRAQEISDRFDNGLDLQSIASAIATSEGIAASLMASYIAGESARSEALDAALAQAIPEYNRRFVENNPLDRHVQQVQSLADQLNREVAQDLEDRQARGQANKRLGVPLKDPFKTSSESREGQAIHRADSYLLWAQEETSKHSGDGRVAADKLLTEAHHTLAAADQSYAEGLGTHGDFALKLTYKLADAALSLAPLAVIALAPEALSLLAVVSAIDIGKSYYEFRTGKRLVGGEEITLMERHLAGVGTILGMLPAGGVILGRLGSFVSEISQLRAVAKFAAIGSENVALDEAADGVQGIFNSAKEAIEAMGPKKFGEVLEMSKGTRPLPETYLPKEYIETHLAKFESGGSRFITKDSLELYGPAQRDGTAFILPKGEADQIIAKANGNIRELEEAIGYKKGFLDDKELMRIDVSNPKKLDARIPSGNEAGVNPLWLPGGKLPNGHSEAVINLGSAPSGAWTAAPVILK